MFDGSWLEEPRAAKEAKEHQQMVERLLTKWVPSKRLTFQSVLKVNKLFLNSRVKEQRIEDMEDEMIYYEEIEDTYSDYKGKVKSWTKSRDFVCFS